MKGWCAEGDVHSFSSITLGSIFSGAAVPAASGSLSLSAAVPSLESFLYKLWKGGDLT